jgi:hypothetical protein
MEDITKIINRYWIGEIEKWEAEALLIDTVSREDLAAFIMDAFCRGWITPFNLGLHEP